MSRATVRKSEYLAKSQNARRAAFLRRKLRDMVFKDEPVERWFQTMVGCTRDALRAHLERQFTEGMSWTNYGVGTDRWSIDHVVPCKNFRLGDFAEDCRAFHYSNLRPMDFCANSAKGARVEDLAIGKSGE